MKYIKPLITLVVTAILLAVLYYSLIGAMDLDANLVTWYGIPSKISLSGDFRFYQTDIHGKRFGDVWFWAIPENLQDRGNVDKIFNLLSQNSTSVFKVSGERVADDCGYYEAGTSAGICISSISVRDVILVE